MSEDSDLWTCTRCLLAPDPSWRIITDVAGVEYHVGADGEPCGPIVANPAVPDSGGAGTGG